ncbi:hypothetical protein VE01_03747 [Pseudogymnoascus verrucosus]|uniref:Zinc-binding domain-containing protein n=1 Tax=Pseudogymnoascus verrucosus TaxID=342668 RepID=A0A1B8GQG4_9PEZI|nr:uncharacterized protein VE01_03747 [Pseudogymnoascus verrucosus]OBT98083.1 hypothetical protein VE01_03747 [Pseudogymnoascus verrucosus]
MEDLLEIELWPEFASSHRKPLEKRQPDRDDFFACCFCVRIRPGWDFETAKMKGRYGKRGEANKDARMGRYCIPCGIKWGKYSRRAQFHVGGWKGCFAFFCTACGGFQREKYRFETYGVTEKRCEYCRQESDYKIYLGAPLPMSQPTS